MMLCLPQSKDETGNSRSAKRNGSFYLSEHLFAGEYGASSFVLFLPLFVRSAERRNYIKGLLDYTGLLLKYEVDLDAEDHVMDKLLRELNDSIMTYNDEFERAKTALSKIESTDVTFRMFDEQSIMSALLLVLYYDVEQLTVRFAFRQDSANILVVLLADTMGIDGVAWYNM